MPCRRGSSTGTDPDPTQIGEVRPRGIKSVAPREWTRRHFALPVTVALLACGDGGTGPGGRPSLVGTYEAAMTAPGFEGAGVTVTGIFLITRQTGGGSLSGSFTLTLAVDGAASESQTGLVVGTVQPDGAVVLTLRIEGATGTRLEGVRAENGNVSGVWGIDDGAPFEAEGMFTLISR